MITVINVYGECGSTPIHWEGPGDHYNSRTSYCNDQGLLMLFIQ